MNKVIAITKIRDGVWHVAYDHVCGCGCTKTRYATTVNQTSKPAQSTAQKAADEHYNSR
jgi:hypothetical protein